MKEAAAASNHILVRNSNACLTNGGKIDPDFTFSWVNILKCRKNFNWDIKF